MIIHDHSQNLLLKWFHFVHAEKVEGKVYRDFDEIIARHMDFRDFFRKFEAWVGDPLDATKNMVVQAKIEYFGRHVVGVTEATDSEHFWTFWDIRKLCWWVNEGYAHLCNTYHFVDSFLFLFYPRPLKFWGRLKLCNLTMHQYPGWVSARRLFYPGFKVISLSGIGYQYPLATLLIGNDRRAGPHHRQSEENHGASTFWPQCSTWRENRWSRAGERNVASLQPRRSNAELQALVARQTDWAWYALMGNWRAKSETRALGGLFGWLSFVWKSFSCAEASNFMVQNHWMEKCSKATQGCEAGAFFWWSRDAYYSKLSTMQSHSWASFISATSKGHFPEIIIL